LPPPLGFEPRHRRRSSQRREVLAAPPLRGGTLVLRLRPAVNAFGALVQRHTFALPAVLAAQRPTRMRDAPREPQSSGHGLENHLCSSGGTPYNDGCLVIPFSAQALRQSSHRLP